MLGHHSTRRRRSAPAPRVGAMGPPGLQRSLCTDARPLHCCIHLGIWLPGNVSAAGDRQLGSSHRRACCVQCARLPGFWVNGTAPVEALDRRCHTGGGRGPWAVPARFVVGRSGRRRAVDVDCDTTTSSTSSSSFFMTTAIARSLYYDRHRPRLQLIGTATFLRYTKKTPAVRGGKRPNA